MHPDDAAAHLAVIRTLMERAALYRRALAPVCLGVGAWGSAAGVTGWLLALERPDHFVFWWLFVAGVGMSLAFFLARRQAIAVHEPFWSPPTRRIAVALVPPLVAGMTFGAPFIIHPDTTGTALAWLPIAWLLLYGCALSSAGFFVQRGLRWFGGAFLLLGFAFLAWNLISWDATGQLPKRSPLALHLLMGACFGGSHIIYALYLRLTESRYRA